MNPSVSWFDSHCHLHDLEDVEGALAAAGSAGVDRVVTVGTDLDSSRRAVALARSHERVWAAVGLHPHDASRLDEEWDALVALAADDRVVAVGETGFDLYYRHSPQDAQEEAFRRHLRLAREIDRALVIHTRDAWDVTFAVLEDEGLPARTVFHCFTGGPAEAARALDLGASLSFSGILTFKSATDVRAAAALVPPGRALVETDAPYLTPEPHRGRRNEPAHLVRVGEVLAAVTVRPVGEVATSTTTAALEVFGLH